MGSDVYMEQGMNNPPDELDKILVAKEIEQYRPFKVVGKDSSIFRFNKYGDVEVYITNARFTTVPDNKWTVRVTNKIWSSDLEYYNEPIEQPEAFSEEERYRYAQLQAPKNGDSNE